MYLCSLLSKSLFKLYQLNTTLYCKYTAQYISGSTSKHLQFFLVKSCLMQVCGLSSYNHNTFILLNKKVND